MPKIPENYQPLHDGCTLQPESSVVQAKQPILAQPIEQPNKDQPIQPIQSQEPLLGLTIINASTPLPTRKKFISKVYSILWFQLLVTSIFIGCCNQIKPLQTFMMSPAGTSIMLFCMIGVIAMTCCLYCMRDVIRKCPGNFLFLTTFTACTTYMVGSAGIVYKLSTLLLAGLSTLGIFSGLSLYAVQTKYDYTDKGGYLLACILGFILFGFFLSFTHYSVASIVYSSIGSLIFSFYIVYDTQLIVGGEHRQIMFHTDDYVIAAISLYLDIINLFLMLLDLLSGSSRN